MSSEVTPFVLLSAARCGTNYLISRLLLTRKVLFGWEPFNSKKFLGYSFQDNDFNLPEDVKAKINSKAFRDESPFEYMQYASGLTGELDGYGIQASGFKIFPIHNHRVYWGMTKATRFSPIVLQRKSVLSVYSSLQIAKETGAWSSNQKTATRGDSAPVKVAFDPEYFEAYRANYLRIFEGTEKSLKTHGIKYFKMYYEDLKQDPAVFADLLEFLGIDGPAKEESWLKVQNDPNVLNRFTNPEAAQKYYDEEQRAEG